MSSARMRMRKRNDDVTVMLSLVPKSRRKGTSKPKEHRIATRSVTLLADNLERVFLWRACISLAAAPFNAVALPPASRWDDREMIF